MFIVRVCIILSILLVLISVVIQYGMHYKKICYSEFDINSVETSLSYYLFGQEEAVRITAETLKKFYSSKRQRLQILVFTGSTGVGKTYAASILKEAFPWRHNIHHFNIPFDFEKLSQMPLQIFNFCGDHFVIMDDLRENNIKDIEYIVTYLTKLAIWRKVVAILVFKFHTQFTEKILQDRISHKVNEIQSYFIKKEFNYEVIDFKTLEKQDVMQCVKEELKIHNIPVYRQVINAIVEKVDYYNEGCKRIASKIAVFHKL